MNVEISILIGCVGAAISVATFFIGRNANAKTEGTEKGNLLTEISYIKKGIDEIKAEQKALIEANTDVRVRLASVEASTKSAHHRLNTIERHLNMTVPTEDSE